jgi:diguanylate cyclase (GGDEF)-like protein/PAS domain S-box-containing protein
MQNTLLDILVLGLLVLLFGSIYRTQRTLRLRYWIVGWLFILAHFVLQLPNLTGFWDKFTGASAVIALMVGGVCFLLASSTTCFTGAPELWMPVLLSAPLCGFVFAEVFGVTNGLVLGGLFASIEASLLFFTIHCWRSKRRILFASLLFAACAAAWGGHEILAHRDYPGLNAILAQIYLMNAMLYWYGFRRRSIGVITAVGGLVAWAAVFPCSVALTALLPHLQVPAELWNLPKYFVEFGMILTLVEGEVIAAMRQREEYRVLFDGNPHPMWIFDRETLRFLKVNDAAVAHYGFSQQEFMAMDLHDIRPEEEIARLDHRLKDAGENTLYSGPWTHLRKDGSKIQVEIASHAIRFEGHPARFSLVQDITERQRLYEQLVHQAHHDSLTGLPNRVLLKDRMEQLLAASERLVQQAAILCIDLDRFKQVNDTLGHHVGDICLQRVATKLRDRLRMTDTVVRSGGEEFIVLLGQMKSPADAARVARMLLESFRQSFMVEGHTISLTASIGIAMYPCDGAAAQHLWRLADSAMYRAKKSGGDRYMFASDDIAGLELDALELELGPLSEDALLEERQLEDHIQGD